MEFDEEDYLQLAGIQHYLFCRRQWAIIHIEQQWAENEKTIDGMFFHQNAHDQNKDERRGDTLIRHALSVHSSSLGLSGQCDVVEFHRSEEGIQLAGETGRWKIYPVEYKRGHEKPDNCDAAQLCAQAMCLEEMYCCDIDSGALFYGEKRHRQIVSFSEELRGTVRETCREMHDLFRHGHTPKAKYQKRCDSCSLHEICAPTLSDGEPTEQYLHRMIETDS